MNRNFHFRVVVVIMILFFVFSSYAQNDPIETKVTAMAFTTDNRKIVAGYEDGTLRIWNDEGKLVLVKKPEIQLESYEKDYKIKSLKISPDGERIIMYVGYKYYLLDKAANKVGSFNGNYVGFSTDNQSIYAFSSGNSGVIYDYSLKEKSKQSIEYDIKNNKGEPARFDIHGFVNQPNGGYYLLCSFKIHERKELFSWWLYSLDASLKVTNRLSLSFDEDIHNAILSSNQQCSKLFFGGWCCIAGKDYLRQGFNYYPKIGKMEDGPPIIDPIMIDNDENTVSKYDDKIKAGNKIINLPEYAKEGSCFYSPNVTHVAITYTNRPYELYSFEKGKLFDFDNSVVVEDKYTFDPVKASGARNIAVLAVQNENKPQFDFSGLKLFSQSNDLMINELDFHIRWNSAGKFHFWDYKGGQVIQGLGNSEATLWNTQFSAEMTFLLPKGSVAITGSWVTFVFWRREENKNKGIYQYSVSVNSIGEVTVARVIDGVHQEWIKKNLMGINITDKVFDRMMVTVDKKGELSCKLYSKNDEPKELKTTIYSPSNEPFTVLLESNDPKFSVAQFTSLKIQGTNIAAKGFPKTLQTKLTGCIAGDCFDGFGYVINDQKEEFCGYFSSGVKENIGQMHRPEEQLTYTGFFNAEIPNGFSLVKYYDRELSELGYFTNYMPDGEMTIYDRYNNMKNAMYKGDNITAIKLTTGCLSGDCQNGNGVFQKENGTRFIGDFVGGKIIKGIIFDDKSRVLRFDSLDSEGYLQGKASVFKSNGEVMYGNFEHGAMHGDMLIKCPVGSKMLFVEGKFENSIGVNITVQFRDGRKWVGKQDSFGAEWASGKGTMTYTDGTTKTGKFKDGEFISE